MEPSESAFFEKLMVTFQEEAIEHIKALSDGLLELEQKLSPDEKQQLIETIFREAHSLKGAARSVNQQNILEICQSLETVLSLWKQNKIELSSNSFDILHDTINVINKALTKHIDANIISDILEKLKNLYKQIEDQSFSDQLPQISSEIDVKEERIVKSEMAITGTVYPNSQETIRVQLNKINRFFQEAEETLMIKMLFKSQLNQLDQLRSNIFMQEKGLKHLFSDFQILQQMIHEDLLNEKKLAKTKEVFKLLEKQIQDMRINREELNKLIKNSEQNTHIASTSIDTLLEDLKKILMQPIGTLFETLPHMVRDISRQVSKDIHLEFQGKEIEIDRRVLEGIKDPIIHLIRNAIDHGIESPHERANCSKPSYGTIRIIASESEGNKVKLSIADDGHGINLNKVKQAALRKKFITEDDLETISDEETLKLIFHSDISTSPLVTELSGRGIGLGIVSEKVDKLGGQTNVVSISGQGTTFTLTLPLTLATFRGVRISVADQEFILPTHNVESVVRVKRKDIKKVENREIIVLENHSFSFIHLVDLLEIRKTKKQSLSESEEFIYALIVKAAEQIIVFGVDDVLSEQEILVKGLGKQNIRVKNIMAATVTETGSVIPILNPVDLIKSSIRIEAIAFNMDKTKNSQNSKKSILLVEDSITTRLLIKNILTSANYEVRTAVDGIEAFEMLQSQAFDLIITDIEMPRMDGFTLLKKIKSMPKVKDLPIIICSSLGSNADRKRGIELGASAYIDKSTFKLDSFVGEVKKLI